MNAVLLSPPRTIMEVFKTLPEGTLAEVIDNHLPMSPAPNPFHRRVAVSLTSKLNAFISQHQLGEIFAAPVDLYLDEFSNAVQPDILYISKDNKLTIDREGLHGVPDLIIEILSPGNKDHDRVTKKELYEKFGVKEYWIVDPETKLSSGYTLQGQTYLPIGEFHEQVESVLLKKTFSY